MILIIGAMASGKLDYAKSLGYTAEDVADAVLDDRPVLNNLQDMVFADPAGSDALYLPLLQKKVVICNEVGSGVIPITYEERAGREATGRLCIRLAQEASQVVRLVCGIPSVIKGAR
jgi:adenosyl cobinamide kinase/adenosyl cobinamide phosphate guanylyltransferase